MLLRRHKNKAEVPVVPEPKAKVEAPKKETTTKKK